MHNLRDGMGTSDGYDYGVLILSTFALILASAYLYRVINTYRLFHDERAAVSLGKAVGLWVIALGLLISASGLIVGDPQISVIGLSLARGALLVTLGALVLAHARPQGRDDE